MKTDFVDMEGKFERLEDKLDSRFNLFEKNIESKMVTLEKNIEIKLANIDLRISDAMNKNMRWSIGLIALIVTVLKLADTFAK